MELLPGIVADGEALYLSGAKTLILSDLHIGYEGERRAAGLLLPEEQRLRFQEELDRLFARHEIVAVILAGDIKHEFGRISEEEWRDVRDLIESIRARGAAVRAVGGNHDRLVVPILSRLGVAVEGASLIRNGETGTLIVHGDQRLEELEAKGAVGREARFSVLIMGHEHPALRVSDGLRSEMVKCFLVGKRSVGRRRVGVVVMPSWNPLAFGTDIVQERPLGPLLDSFRNFSAFVSMEGKVLAFGRVEALQRLQRA